MRTQFLLVPALVTAFVAAACGSDSGDSGNSTPADTCPHDYSKFNGQTPAVSFQADVLPVMRRGCGLSSVCHGAASGSAADLYLGPKLSDPEPDATARQQIVSAMVGVASKTAPSMSLVASGDPAQSFMMLKMDGCQDSAGLTCTAQPGATGTSAGGDSMPQASPILSADERNLFRRWIAQGAQAD